MASNNLVVGPQTRSDGAESPFRGGKAGELLVQNTHGKYYEAVKRDKCFYAATAALVTTTVGLATTYTGLCVSNPITSTVDLVLLQASMMQSVIQATQIEAYALATGFLSTTNVTHTTPVTPRAALVGSTTTPNGLADVAATLSVAPFYTMFVTNTGTAVANSTGNLVVTLDGSIVLKPGGFICWVTPAQASVAGLWFSFLWEEVATA